MEYEEIENIDSLQYKAHKALILYSLSIDNGPTVNASLPGNYVSIHEIRNNILCEGKPITKKALYNLCKIALPSLQIKTSYIPEKVIAYSAIEKTLIWWIPGQIKTLFFRKDTDIPSGKAPIPPLLFVYRKNRLMIYALKDNERPVPETKIFNTPFFNSGCMGNVKISIVLGNYREGGNQFNFDWKARYCIQGFFFNAGGSNEEIEKEIIKKLKLHLL